MSELSDFLVGQTVELQDGRTATVRFAGNTHFAPGDWVGVELEDASGKNDGAVQGRRYFECASGYGMFVRPTVATIIDQPTPKPVKKTAGAPNGGAVKSRPSIVTDDLRKKGVTEFTTAERESINVGSPTPGAKFAAGSRALRSPSKSPTKQLFSKPSSRTSTPGFQSDSKDIKATTNAPKPRTSLSGRPSLVPPSSTASRAPRQSISGAANGSVRSLAPPTRRPVGRLSTLQQNPKRSDSTSGRSQASGQSGTISPTDSHEQGFLSPAVSDGQDEQSRSALSPALSGVSADSRALTESNESISHDRLSPKDNPAPTLSSIVQSREVEDLKTKLRVMEKKRMDDRDKLKTLDRIQSERDKFEIIIQKLQAKMQPQQQEIVHLKKQLKEAEAKFNAQDNDQINIDEALEMATLDREMAEETAEALRTELDTLRQKHEELELEVEILREENVELGKEMSPEEKSSQGWMQMERSNERLREALTRLRDVAQDQEAALKQEIKDMRKDLQEFITLRTRHDEVKARLIQSDAAVEDLRQQLENALGAEEMIEELTEKNMSLSEQIEHLKTAVEDLESLKELNDELEVNHMETEKQMQDEVDYKDALFREQTRKSAVQDEAIQDLEYTVSRFRDLVTNLQSDLEDMRASQQITETEANELSSRSRAMLDLNLRLQVSASKAQVKAIDLELRRLDAQESAEHLAIVQMFLPESFAPSRDSIRALLCLKRVGFKANLLHGFVKERMNAPPTQGSDDDIFACCDVLDKLTWISAMCGRLEKFIQTCSLEEFGRLHGVLYDLEPVERSINSWIDGLKKDEMKEQQCSAELSRSIALLTHLAETHLSDSLEGWAEDLQMRASIIQSNLENSATALSHIKTIAQDKISSNSEEDAEEEAEAEHFFQKADTLISQMRSAKVISSKASRRLEELKFRSLTLNQSTLPTIEQAQSSTQELFALTKQSGLSSYNLIKEESRTTPFTANELIKAISSNDVSPFSTLTSKLTLTITHINSFHNLTTTLSQTIEFPSPPPPPLWHLLSQKLHHESTLSASHETDLHHLQADLAETHTALALKDKTIDDLSVNIEVLSKRISDSGSRRERLRELETQIETSRSKERESVHRLTRLESELKNLEAERESWKLQATKATTNDDDDDNTDPSHSTTRPNDPKTQSHILALTTEISTLQSTIRHLRLSIPQHSPFSPSSTSFLSTPLLPAPPHNSPIKPLDLSPSSLLDLVTRPENQLVALKDREKEERLAWRPWKEQSRWCLERQREVWQGEGEGEGARAVGRVGRREWVFGVGAERRRRMVRREVVLKGEVKAGVRGEDEGGGKGVGEVGIVGEQERGVA